MYKKYTSQLSDTTGIKDLYTQDSKEFVKSKMDSVTTVDSRHSISTKWLKSYFSEMALHEYRARVEIMHLINMSEHEGFDEVKELSEDKKNELYRMMLSLDKDELWKIVEYDHYWRNDIQATEHDVKAVEYYLKEKLDELWMWELKPFIHIFCTSEDINNIAYSCMLRDGFNNELLPKLRWILERFSWLILQHKDSPMMARTHGQPASPTTFWKEIAVFTKRITNHLERLDNLTLSVKFNWAVGNLNSHVLAKPDVDWLEYSKSMAETFGFNDEQLTNQRWPMTEVVSFFQIVKNVNNILLDFCRDTWSYNKDGLVYHKKVVWEVGSSVMPQKVNPWFLEEAEWCLKQANSMLDLFINNSDVSRLQRDMSGHPHERNYWDAFGNTLIAWTNILESLDRIEFDDSYSWDQLDKHLEVVTEWIQTVLRREKLDNAYELLKSYVRWKKLQVSWEENPIELFVRTLWASRKEIEENPVRYNSVMNSIEWDSLKEIMTDVELSASVVSELLSIANPKNFLGMAPQLAEKANNHLVDFMHKFDNKVALTNRKKIHAILTDFDNTLQLWDKEELNKRISSIITDVNNMVSVWKRISEEEIEIICSYSDYREMRRYISEKTWLKEDAIQLINNKYSWQYDEEFYLDTMTPELLDLAIKNKIPVATISTRWNQSLSRLVDVTHNIWDKMEFFLWRDDVKNRKPDPEWINKAISKLSIPVESRQWVYYLWDKYHEDVKAARFSKTQPIYINRRDEWIDWRHTRNLPVFNNISEAYNFFWRKLV